MKKTKIRPNDACPCGSGKKYKRCHRGSRAPKPVKQDGSQYRIGVEEFQVRRQQGVARPIKSEMVDGRRLVHVGRRTFVGPWRSFHDFLYSYLEEVLGAEWFRAETNASHPTVDWRREMARLSQLHSARDGEVKRIQFTGGVGAYLSLAYDLYTIEHNASLENRLLRRLRNQDQFFGAWYEVRIAAMMIRAGFRLEWEDESDRSSTHCEFNATWPATGVSFGVECKFSHRATEQGGWSVGRISGLVRNALLKETSLRRLVFVDVNLPAQEYIPGAPNDWRNSAVNALRRFEGDPQSKELPGAVIVVTNFPDHHHIDKVVLDAGLVVEGFKIDDYRNGLETTLNQKLIARARNPEIEAFLASVVEHREIPVTFDGGIPWVQSDTRLLIGERYVMDDERAGVLEDATVDETSSTVFLILRGDDGGRYIYSGPLSESELAAWQRFPETFFGEPRQRGKSIEDPLEFYDSVMKAISGFSKENLLRQMSDESWGATDMLEGLTQQELAERYVGAFVNAAVRRFPSKEVPLHIRRMRPVPRKKS